MITSHEKYFEMLKEKLLDFFRDNSEVKIFLFGSSVKEERFGDVDIGISGEIKENDVRKLRDVFEESNFPFSVDVIDFNKVDESFKKNVLDNKVLWIKR